MNGFVAYPYSLDEPTNPNSGYVRGPTPKGAAPPVGRVGYLPAFSTNKSSLGYRGSHKFEGMDLELIFQIETQPSITSSPGLNTSQFQQSNGVTYGTGQG